MATREEKKARQGSLLKFKERQRAKLESGLPISKSEFVSLFDWLDQRLASAGCDHTLTFTRRYLKDRALPEATTIDWLTEHGGYCDCEVLANVADELNKIL